jgi:hypothetical protein
LSLSEDSDSDDEEADGPAPSATIDNQQPSLPSSHLPRVRSRLSFVETADEN